MTRLKNKLKLNIILGITITIIFLACVPMFVLSLLNIMRSLLTMVFSMVGFIAGVYGVPLVWSSVYKLCKMKKVYKEIQAGTCDIQTLSQKTKMSPRRVKYYLARLHRFDYISSISVSETPIYSEPLQPTIVNVTCAGCGKYYVKQNGDNACPYCGRLN